MLKPVIEQVIQQTHNKFLNMFEIKGINTKGYPFRYFTAARAEDTVQYFENLETNHIDAISVFATTEDNKVVLIRQWRYPCNDFIIEFPSGLIDSGETVEQAAIREFKEETGLDIEVVSSNPVGYFPSCGLSCERLAPVFGKVIGGEISTKYQERSEDIEVLLVDKKEAKRILLEEKVALNCAVHLQYWVSTEN